MAREAFATLGYERATVRTIAQMANVHPSTEQLQINTYERIVVTCALLFGKTFWMQA